MSGKFAPAIVEQGPGKVRAISRSMYPPTIWFVIRHPQPQLKASPLPCVLTQLPLIGLDIRLSVSRQTRQISSEPLHHPSHQPDRAKSASGQGQILAPARGTVGNLPKHSLHRSRARQYSSSFIADYQEIHPFRCNPARHHKYAIDHYGGQHLKPEARAGGAVLRHSLTRKSYKSISRIGCPWTLLRHGTVKFQYSECSQRQSALRPFRKGVL